MPKKIFNIICTTFLVAAITGCASGYKEYYKSAPKETLDMAVARRSGSPPAMPAVEHANSLGNAQDLVKAYIKRSYLLIGWSTFNSGRVESEEAAIQQGRDILADLVLIFNPKYSGSVTSTVPISVPTTTTTYSSGSATVYGSGGKSATAYGSGTSTTYGTTTNYVPFTIDKYDYGALYFVKMRPTFGAVTRELSDSERQALQSNKGAVIDIVINDSPAFNADLLVGDVIVSVDGVMVSNTKAFYDLLKERSGKSVSLVLLRQGKQIEKQVQSQN